MLKRWVGTVAVVSAMASPVLANEMNADEARRFVVGKVFAFNCFDGTRGAGRVLDDGSVAGSVQIAGEGPVRYARLPSGTLRVKGGNVCASVKGLPFEPCFNLVKTDDYSFRGSVSGMGFAYCTFTRRGGRIQMASSLRARAGRPVDLSSPATAGSATEVSAASLKPPSVKPVAVKPVEAKALDEAKPADKIADKPPVKPTETARAESTSLSLRPTAD